MADKKAKPYTPAELAVQFVKEIAAGNFSPREERRSNDVERGVATYKQQGQGGAAGNAASTLTKRKRRDDY